jgi:hypothetical protein
MLTRVFVNRNPLNSIHTYHMRKSLNWNLRRPCDKLNQLSQILLTVLCHHLPKPNYYLVRWIITRIIGVLFHVLNIHLRHPRDQQLYLFGLEIRYTLLRYHLVEPLQKFIYLRREVVPHLSHTVLFYIFYINTYIPILFYSETMISFPPGTNSFSILLPKLS